MEPLVDWLTAERDEAIRERDELLEQVRYAGQQTREWHNAFYSVLCALDSAMEVLEHAPQDMRTRMMMEIGAPQEYDCAMQRLQAFKHELMPSGVQARQMRRLAGSCRFV